MMLSKRVSIALMAGVLTAGQCGFASAGECPDSRPVMKNLYWGDLHVHTAYSLDAFAFGTVRTPSDAYAFARGRKAELAGGATATLDRPLDFMAVTDHAEWLDLMYLCTDPQRLEDPYCAELREKSSPASGPDVFRNYVLPTITHAAPERTPVCAGDPERCDSAMRSQWQRIQVQANAANEPCAFTAFIGFEWTYTPNHSHSHRNLIFANEHVTRDAIDYIRHPTLDDLWSELDSQCRAEDACEVIAIPHNTNMGDGIGFDVETESERQLALRSRYEKLIEIHQEKGNSECLPAFDSAGGDDCGFEISLTRHSASTAREEFSRAEWDSMRRTYVRGLLLRGLAGYRSDAPRARRNALQLGFIGSTDTHAATPGYVDESEWQGSAIRGGDFDAAMKRLNWNPGGLVAVWAEENTRASIFAALKRREVYATSGPRIGLRFLAATKNRELSCDDAGYVAAADVSMGGDFSTSAHPPQFLVAAQFDKTPLRAIEIVKGVRRDGKVEEQRTVLWSRAQGSHSACATWRDAEFDADEPAFWYARVLEMPSPRWSAVQCEKLGRCADYPDAKSMIQERAWASPIWYLPGD